MRESSARDGDRPPISLEAAAMGRIQGISLYRCQQLAYNLRSTVEALAGPRPGDCAGEHLDAYLRLRWLCWDGRRLVLTPAGARVG